MSVKEELRTTVAGLVGADPASVADDDNLVLLGLGSLEMMRLVTKWRRSGLKVEFRDLAATPTISAWTSKLEEASA
ncbi:phosphopantetheine-binding protein [Herbidospora mongoliensis]|uniref:phosphopantetheine-binding protein n=1 Tax=Herbidospora mongoliensis TaxID=688067 RepID=UPI00083130B9|nr:phosphopantetheine-binding protein [Herbidospora mongoliensis]